MNCNFYFSLFEGQGCPSFACGLSLTFDPDCADRPMGEERKLHFHCLDLDLCLNFYEKKIHIDMFVNSTVLE